MKVLEVRQIGSDIHVTVDGKSALVMENRRLDDIFTDNPLTALLAIIAIRSTPE